MTSSIRFVLNWLVALVTLAILVAGFNAIVDPYDVFGSPRLAGINRFKPEAKNHSMLAKTYQVERFRPTTILLGSSRVHIGIDAHGPAWPASMQPVYNYAIPRWYGTYTSYRSLQEADAIGHLKYAVIFLDFQNFFAPEPVAVIVADEDQRRLLVQADGSANPLRTRQRLDDAFLSLLTMGALIDSASTILAQRQPVVLDLPLDGSSTEADFINAAREDGMHDLFAQKEAFEADRTHGLARALAGWTDGLPNLDIVARIIAFSRAHDIALTLAIAPSHADTLELYWRDGLWLRVEQFKTELAAMVAKDGHGAVTLWDFSDYSEWTTEPVPPPGDRQTATHWYWESTHFKKALGTLMIRRMFDGDPSPFGVRLTPDNVAARNAEVRQQRQALICKGRLQSPTSLPDPASDGCKESERTLETHRTPM
jgi:hypothetical protein